MMSDAVIRDGECSDENCVIFTANTFMPIKQKHSYTLSERKNKQTNKQKTIKSMHTFYIVIYEGIQKPTIFREIFFTNFVTIATIVMILEQNKRWAF